MDDDEGQITLSSLDELSIHSHPVLVAKVSQLRNKDTKSHEFRQLTKQIATILGLEASRNLDVKPVPGLRTPIAPYTGAAIASRVGIMPILRAGIGMTEGKPACQPVIPSHELTDNLPALLDLFPDAPVYHLGIYRDQMTLDAVEYYQKLPPEPEVDTVFILDPLIATGGTAIAAINAAYDWGVPISHIKLISIIASMPGLRRVLSACPGIEIHVAAVDADLDKGIIVPGLADCGDRLFPQSYGVPKHH
ncbi:uncharacterized protein L969DRAFT_18225 [Mixia osmundae IAM 14324]|uniref:uncharacterized protein n=1 Tax=Mixia osmundae (strain CBS 9802 / IAM 14324 / JCM 22182 / KY 12970) TaxID=764103 RepID=UPI0004A54C05|nr:uncharacterized protein L969DRAFT_18225 [Mixia osmundae IAM 14324]KEI38201.1 hypothetical protein L969DRAFT_18225 [Mixia osmundae IAM 14324]